MALTLAEAGQVCEALAAVSEAIDHSERTEELWQIAEVLRVKGEPLQLQGAPAAAAPAENNFRQALDWARRQGALAWELRAATSLARLLRDQDRTCETRDLCCLRFIAGPPRGSETADLQNAKRLLDASNSRVLWRPLLALTGCIGLFASISAVGG